MQWTVWERSDNNVISEKLATLNVVMVKIGPINIEQLLSA